MRLFVLTSLVLLTLSGVNAQSNILFTNPEISTVLSGNYDPVDYAALEAIDDPHVIASQLSSRINQDSLHSYLKKMSAFETRNTGSDTMSNVRGIGAARRWSHQMFEKFSIENDGRLEVGFLQFNELICGVDRHKNIVAVLPGRELIEANGNQAGIVIIEGHLDSRCDQSCDTSCVAEGMEDNGSGSALVLELARVMAKYTYNRTIVFMLTTGEEQGLRGANAMAQYCWQNDVPVTAVLNNDVIGGIICGKTSSPPSCPSENDIDSTQVRLFSAGSFNSPSKQLARYIKLQYEEELVQHVDVPHLLTIMTSEDRVGRGGDHIPFRQIGYPAMRFTSANEHGDASNGPGYDDRQHTSEDVLGVDTDNDGQLDSFFVNFNYLARNVAINANAASMIAQNVCSDLELDLRQISWRKIQVDFEGEGCIDPPFRIAVRSETNDWDTLIAADSSRAIIELPLGDEYAISACRVDEQGVESLFSGEEFILIAGEEEKKQPKAIELLQNRPNPFDESTAITFYVHDMPAVKHAEVQISDHSGREVKRMEVPIQYGMNEIIYNHGYGKVGTYLYSLIIDGQIIDTKKMVFVAY